jgi:hypothetical protein
MTLDRSRGRNFLLAFRNFLLLARIFRLEDSSDLSKLLLESGSIPLLDTEDVVQERSHGDVEKHVRPNNAKVPPSLRIVDVGPGQELVCVAQRAVSAVSRGVRVLQLAGSHGHEVG